MVQLSAPAGRYSARLNAGNLAEHARNHIARGGDDAPPSSSTFNCRLAFTLEGGALSPPFSLIAWAGLTQEMTQVAQFMPLVRACRQLQLRESYTWISPRPVF